MKNLDLAIVIVALLAAAVALICTGNGDWIFGLIMLGAIYLF